MLRTASGFVVACALSLCCLGGYAQPSQATSGAAGALEQGPSNWVAPTYFAPPAAGAHSAGGRQALGAPTSAPLPFVAVTPCRLVDTRGNGAPLTGGFLPASTVRTYTFAGLCNIPADAKAISLNATAVNPVGPGFLAMWAEGGTFPLVSTLNFVGNEVVANAAVVPLSATGSVSVVFGVSGADLVLDTNGYFSPLGAVTSLNGQGGDLTLVAGSNITLTPGAGTLSISAASGTGPQGPAGPTGPTGPQGATGPTGPSGISPLVFGPYASGSPDSSVCGNDWATDTFTRTYIVTPQSNGSFSVTELFNGTFVTLAGFSPNDCAVTIPAGITGRLWGNEAFTIPVGADFDFTATCPAGCTGTQFTTTFFNTAFPATYAWQFHYTTASNGSWNNTDHGNTGNIHP